MPATASRGASRWDSSSRHTASCAATSATTRCSSLDDVFAELDSGRRERLAALVADCEQVLITAAVGADVPDVLRESGTTYAVVLGQVHGGGLTRRPPAERASVEGCRVDDAVVEVAGAEDDGDE